MPYVEGRVVHDADTHIMEIPGFWNETIERRFLPVVEAAGLFERRPGFRAQLPDLVKQQDDPGWRAADGEQILLRKNWNALGAFRAQDRPAALDHLGFASQLVFTTALLSYLPRLEHGDDVDLAYAAARAHNRHMVAFCSTDRRLLPAGYVPLMDFARSAELT